MDLNIEDFIPLRPITRNDVLSLSRDYAELLLAEQECFKAARMCLDNTSTNLDVIEQVVMLVDTVTYTPSNEGLISMITNFLSKLKEYITKFINWISTIISNFQMKKQCDQLKSDLLKLYNGGGSSTEELQQDADKDQDGVQVFKIDPPYLDEKYRGICVSSESLRKRTECMFGIHTVLKTNLTAIRGCIPTINVTERGITKERLDEMKVQADKILEQFNASVKQIRPLVQQLNSDEYKLKPVSRKQSWKGDSDVKKLALLVHGYFSEWTTTKKTLSIISNAIERVPTGTIGDVDDSDDIRQSKEAVLKPLRTLLPLVRAVRDVFANDMKELAAIRAAVKAQFKESYGEISESANTGK